MVILKKVIWQIVIWKKSIWPSAFCKWSIWTSEISSSEIKKSPVKQVRFSKGLFDWSSAIHIQNVRPSNTLLP